MSASPSVVNFAPAAASFCSISACEKPGPRKAPDMRRPFADAVHRQHRGALERRGIEGGGRVAEMMLAEQQTAGIKSFGEFLQLAAQQVFLEQFFAQP